MVQNCAVKRCNSTNIELQRTIKMKDGVCEETFYCNDCGAKFFIESKIIDVWSNEEFWGDDIYPIIFDDEKNTRFHKAVMVIKNIIDEKNQSVRAVIQMLVIESFGTQHDSDIASEILSPIKEKHKVA